MNKSIIGLAVTVLLTFSFTVNAATNTCTYGDTTEIYFVNGVWNSLAQARKWQMGSGLVLRILVAKVLWNKHCLDMEDALMKKSAKQDLTPIFSQKRDKGCSCGN